VYDDKQKTLFLNEVKEGYSLTDVHRKYGIDISYMSDLCRRHNIIPLSRRKKIFICKSCGKKIVVGMSNKQKFCSKKCNGKFFRGDNNVSKRRCVRNKIKMYWKKRRKYMYCQVCGKKFVYSGNKKLCSKKCVGKYMSKKMEGKVFSEKHRENLSLSHMNKKHTEKQKEKIGLGNRKAHKKRKYGFASHKNIKLTEEHKINIGLANKNSVSIGRSSRERWKNKVYKEKTLKAILKSISKLPTSYERKIIYLNKKYGLPFRYCGNGKVIIHGLCPDFIERNGKKLLIETYTKWCHPINYEKQRYAMFRQFGFRTLFLSDEDLLNKDWEQICLKKIKKFLGDKN